MTTQRTEEARPENGPPASESEMAKYGITRVPVDYYHYGQFRYTNLDDALAQAKREEQAR